MGAAVDLRGISGLRTFRVLRALKTVSVIPGEPIRSHRAIVPFYSFSLTGTRTRTRTRVPGRGLLTVGLFNQEMEALSIEET